MLDWKFLTFIPENSEDFDAFCDVSTNTSVSFDDWIDYYAPNNVSVYVPVKNNFIAINWHDLNEEDLILGNATNVMKVTSGNDNNNDHNMFNLINENMTTSDYSDGNVNHDVPSMN